MNVFEMITNYFNDENHGVNGYEPIGFRRKNETDDYLYVVIARYIGECNWKKGTYAVWTSFNTSMDGGNMNNGHYELSFKDALTVFNGEETKPISWDRLSELATLFKDYIEESNEDNSFDLFNDMELTKKEMDYFGIEPPKLYKKVDVTCTVTFPVIINNDEDEYKWDYKEAFQEYVQYNGIAEADVHVMVDEADMPADMAINDFPEAYQDCDF